MKVLMFGWEFPPHISGGLGTACYGLTYALAQEKVKVLFVVPKLHGDEPGEDVKLINASNVIVWHKKTSASPKAFSDIDFGPVQTTTNNEMSFSGVPLPKTDPALGQLTYKQEDSENFSAHDLKEKQKTVKDVENLSASERVEDQITHIEVPSTLMPYQSTSYRSEHATLVQWHYQFPEHYTSPTQPYADIVEKRPQFETGTHPEVLMQDFHEGDQGTYSTDFKNTYTGNQPYERDPALAPAPEIKGVTYAFSGTYGATLQEEVTRYAEVASQISREYTFDAIHAHDWMTFPAGIAAKKESGKPLVVHVHATEFDRSGNHVNPVIYEIEREGLMAADRVIAVSQWTKNILVTRYNIPADKIQAVHNGIVPKPLTKTFTTPPIGSHVVTFLGRVTYQKGPHYFIEAAQIVLQQFPNAHFVVAGSGDLLPHMIERVAQLRISSRFHFTGFLQRDLIDKIWSLSNVYVMPSVSEPFGITPLEAIQSDVPVIVSNQSGVAEVMPHAIKVDFWNIEELANAICSVLKYESLSKTLKKNGKTEIENLSWSKAAKKIKTLYHELITEHP